MLYRFLVLLAALCLVACEQVINRGPVGGATIELTRLRDGALIYTGTTSTVASVVEAQGESAWASYSDAVRLQRLGRRALPATLPVEAQAWYLLTARGGSDYDPDGDGLLDNETGEPVQGTIRALLRGSQLGATAVAISPLTETAYLFVADFVGELTDDELAITLDEVAADLVADANNSGAVDYQDLLYSNRLLFTDATLRLRSAGLSALAFAIEAGTPEEGLQVLVRGVTSRNAPRLVAEARYASEIHQPIIRTRCESCHLEGGLGARASNNVVVRDTDPDYAARNTENFRQLVFSFGAEGVLERARGIGHGGGALISPSDPEYDDFEAWLNLL